MPHARLKRSTSSELPGPRLEGTELVLESFLPYRIAVVAHKVSRALSLVYAQEFGLSIPEWRIIANLGRCGPLLAGELAERSNMDKPKVSRALRRLEGAGVLNRKIGHEDRRQARLALTPKGRKLFKVMASMALGWEREFLGPLDAIECAALDRLLQKLDARADAMGGSKRAENLRIIEDAPVAKTDSHATD